MENLRLVGCKLGTDWVALQGFRPRTSRVVPGFGDVRESRGLYKGYVKAILGTNF